MEQQPLEGGGSGKCHYEEYYSRLKPFRKGCLSRHISFFGARLRGWRRWLHWAFPGEVGQRCLQREMRSLYAFIARQIRECEGLHPRGPDRLSQYGKSVEHFRIEAGLYIGHRRRNIRIAG